MSNEHRFGVDLTEHEAEGLGAWVCIDRLLLEDSDRLVILIETADCINIGNTTRGRARHLSHEVRILLDFWDFFVRDTNARLAEVHGLRGELS